MHCCSAVRHTGRMPRKRLATGAGLGWKRPRQDRVTLGARARHGPQGSIALPLVVGQEPHIQAARRRVPYPRDIWEARLALRAGRFSPTCRGVRLATMAPWGTRTANCTALTVHHASIGGPWSERSDPTEQKLGAVCLTREGGLTQAPNRWATRKRAKRHDRLSLTDTVDPLSA